MVSKLEVPPTEILAGPILRRLEAKRIVLWLASRSALKFRIRLDIAGAAVDAQSEIRHQQVRTGHECYFHLLDLPLDQALPVDCAIPYDVLWSHHTPAADAGQWTGLADWADDLCHHHEPLPRLVLRSKVDNVLHGSCRKPHHPAADGLVAADRWLQAKCEQPQTWPAALLMTGDQVYVDDVAGPMLTAVHELIDVLGLYPEQINGAVVSDSTELFASELNYYRRSELLPDTDNAEPLQRRFFEGARKPIFTTANADNHLVTLAEMLAMYLLVWSPVPWRLLSDQQPLLPDDKQARYRLERERLQAFVAGLPAVRRLLAHLPTVMIFDDHDITDDWNLTADWERTAYGHPFSRRIIGNAMIAYLLCQGWGNNPDAFDEDTMPQVQRWSEQPDSANQDALIDHLLTLQCWHFTLPTEPRLVFLDTRTRRWRSESNLRHPSGLMDWEALSELQTELLHHKAVILVSPAPVFGVKLIEVVQRVFTLLGKPLLVDAENWMAHQGTANVILNIFSHTKTPANFVILSGDVHYSFVYGIQLRTQAGTPHIWQVTSSGIKNEFPERLLNVLDRLNRWLYSPRSPLNWFTRRRRLKISPYRPSGASRGERLLNGAGIGHVCFADDGRPVLVEQITDTATVAFETEGHC